MNGKMNNILILFISVVIVVAVKSYGFHVCGLDLVIPEAQGECRSCHNQSSQKVLENHLMTISEEKKHCLKCHSLEGKASVVDWLIHLHHYAQKEFKGDCFSCHLIDEGENFRRIGSKEGKATKITKDSVEKMGTYFESWATSDHLDHLHAKESITCKDCHDTFFPEKNVSRERCLSCHGSYKDLAISTEDLQPNPHASHHLNLRCTVCHKAHKESVLYCNLCHDFELEVP